MLLFPRIALLGFMLGMLVGCGSEWEPLDSAAFVASHDLRVAETDPQTCTACHAETVAQWHDSHHALANRLVSLPEDKAAFSPPRQLISGDSQWEFSLSGGQPHIAYRYGADAKQSYRPVGVIGIDPLIQYLIPLPGGKFQVTSAAYDPKAGDWFNVFGDDPRAPGEWGHWTGQGMNWNANCAYCHMTDFHKNLEPETTTYKSTWKAQGIQCAQCHTGLADHLASARKGGDVLPATLTPEQWQASCATCHSRREELTPNTFEPGDNYNDHFRIALPDSPGVYEADGQVADEDFVYGSMLLNRMGHAGITCLDCHNAHATGLKLPVENNALCLTCHTTGDRGAVKIDLLAHSHHAEGSAGSNCVACHMPSNNFMVRDPRRDHIFNSPDPVLTKKIGVTNACNRCHQDQTVDWAIEWSEKWYGEKLGGRTRERALVIDAYNRGELENYTRLLELARTEELVGWRSSLVAMLRPWVSWGEVRQFLQGELTHPEALVRSAAVRALSGLPESERLRLLTPLLSDEIRLVRLDAALALPPFSINDELRAELDAYLRMNADRSLGALRLAQRDQQRGERQAVAMWARRAIGLDPASPQVAQDGAVLLAQTGDSGQSLAVLGEAIARHPGNAGLLFSQGLLLAEQGDHAGAARSLEASLLADPENTRTWFNLSLIHDQRRDLTAALVAIEEALARDPMNSTYLQAKASFLHKLGRTREAQQLINSLQRTAPPAPDRP